MILLESKLRVLVNAAADGEEPRSVISGAADKIGGIIGGEGVGMEGLGRERRREEQKEEEKRKLH